MSVYFQKVTWEQKNGRKTMLMQNNYFIVVEKPRVYHFDYHPDFFFILSTQFRHR